MIYCFLSVCLSLSQTLSFFLLLACCMELYIYTTYMWSTNRTLAVNASRTPAVLHKCMGATWQQGKCSRPQKLAQFSHLMPFSCCTQSSLIMVSLNRPPGTVFSHCPLCHLLSPHTCQQADRLPPSCCDSLPVGPHPTPSYIPSLHRAATSVYLCIFFCKSFFITPAFEKKPVKMG